MQAADDVLQESRWHDVAAYLRSRGATKGLASKDEASLLCTAAEDGWVQGLQQLIFSQGLSPDLCSYDGRTAMHMACIGGRYKVVEGLLKLGANQNIKDRWGQTPMAIAITAKQQMVITVLASSKAKLDMASPELALCTAAGAGDAQQVKRLIDFGVAPNIGVVHVIALDEQYCRHAGIEERYMV